MAQESPLILVVEDDIIIRDTLVEFLEDEGYAVEGAANGQEALEQLQSSPPPALILLDLRMPVMNGLQFLEERQHMPGIASIPVVLLSADRTGQQRVAPHLVVEHLEKPVGLAEMLKVVERYCRPRPAEASRH